jgi:hypothetical protein
VNIFIYIGKYLVYRNRNVLLLGFHMGRTIVFVSGLFSGGTRSFNLRQVSIKSMPNISVVAVGNSRCSSIDYPECCSGWFRKLFMKMNSAV